MLAVSNPPLNQSQRAISLEPITGNDKVLIDDVRNYTGACGGAVVRILGVTSVSDEAFYLDPDASIIVRRPPEPDLRIDDEGIISDRNGVACLSYEGQARLLIWAACGGSACSDEYSFTVIDPDKLKIISPKNSEGGCDEMCAYSLTGSRLPWELNHKDLP